MQILVIEEGLYTIIAGIYTFIARIYDIMLKLVQSGSEAGSIADFYISDVATVMYTIAGVFMLFRVTIAMINMLINPDAINDGKAGAGKLITRIVTSILLLIVFVPNGFIFGDDGILTRLEGALLAEDGLINNIMPNSKTSQVKGTAMNVERTTKSLIDNVYAANQMDCYYVYISHNLNDGAAQHMTAGDSNSALNKSKIGISEELHLTFYPNKTGKNDLCNDVTIGDDCSKYSYTADTKSPYSNFTEKIKWATLNNGWPSESNCPNIITKAGKASDSSKSWDDESNAGKYVGGWHTHDAMQTAISANNSATSAIGDNASAIKEDLGLSNGDSLAGVSQAAIAFAQNSMGTFLTCSDDSCESLKSQALIGGDKEIKSALGNDTMELEFIPALIAGIGILVWIVVLCVDVIIRRFKLLLLQMIAPIPIISYADPNDQMFNKWGKMYISTYLDLFLKLIAISFAVSLLEIVWVIRPNSAIETFFYVVAILVFAKMIPSMISDIFGIKLGSGTFKDITGMGKSALGFGAGALLGGAIGAATGAQAGNGIFGKIGSGALGGVKGAALGAGSGAKGNVTGGAKSIAATNALKAQGLNWFDRLRYQGLGALGIDPNLSERGALAQTEQALTQVENVQGHISNIDSSIDRTPEVAAFIREINNGVIKDPTGNKAKTMREMFANAYDTGRTDPLSISDVENTSYYQKLKKHDEKNGTNLASDFKQEFEQDYNSLYGTGANLTVSQDAWGAGYQTAKSAWLNGINLLRDDKETVAFINKMVNDGKITQKNADALLKGEYSLDTSYTTIAGAVKGATFGPQGELKNDIARQKQELSFADRKVKTGK